jgi:Spy/CpxP family protein refolding chaperone
MMIYKFRRILTFEQHVKLQKLFDERERERRGKGHGQNK